jgi:S-methylmethionine-dependent homocysteine/selenocysteine methylase
MLVAMDADITLLDGGMGQELLLRTDAAPTPLWSTQVMADSPDLVRDVHLDYLRAGADVIIVNTYSATRSRLDRAGRGDEFEHLQELACTLAHEARAESGRTGVRVAGCLSPYGWSYRPELAPPYEELWPRYAEAARIQAPHVDLMICETMGSIEEARSAVRGAAEADVPVWVSWSVLDDDTARLRSGEAVADAVAAVRDFDVEAVLLNCSIPEAIDAALPSLAAADLPFGAYANGFRRIVEQFQAGSTVDELEGRPDLDPPGYLEIVSAWVDAGATIVGGCCEIGPDHIALLAERLGRPVS